MIHEDCELSEQRRPKIQVRRVYSQQKIQLQRVYPLILLKRLTQCLLLNMTLIQDGQ